MADYDDVALSQYRDVSDDVTGAEVTSGVGPSLDWDQMTAGCSLYKFVVDCVNGLVCVLGFIGNLIAFAVFHKDSMKTSTSFLFQVVSDVDRVERFRTHFKIFRRRFDGVVIYFFNSDFKFFDDAWEFSICSFYVVIIFS